MNFNLFKLLERWQSTTCNKLGPTLRMNIVQTTDVVVWQLLHISKAN